MDDLDSLTAGVSRRTASSRQHRLRGALVVLQLALSLVLLCAAGLMGRSLARLASVGLGFDSERMLAVGIELDEARYPAAPARRELFERLIATVRRLPGVAAVTLANGLPPRGGGISFDIAPHAEDQPRPRADRSQILPSSSVAEDYFRVTGSSYSRTV